MASCTVIINAVGDTCGQPAVHVRDSIFGGQLAECELHYMAAPAAGQPVEARVSITWYGWPKEGTVIAEKGDYLDVRFVPRKGEEPITRAFRRDRVRFL